MLTTTKDSQRLTQQTSIMENVNVPNHLRDHDYCRERRTSARQAESVRTLAAQCPCCSDDQVPNVKRKRQHSTTAAELPRKRKRTSMAHPSKASAVNPAAGEPKVLDWDATPQPSTSAADIPELLNLVPKPRTTTPPADLPAPLHHDSPLKIHNRSVEEYQQIYHEVVDDMLKYKSSSLHPYSLALGRRIKQKLWEKLDRPTFTESLDGDGLVHVDVSYGVGVYPPLYDVDITGEPNP
ncbi:uncharacterized protein LOC116063516 isoform X2 [Sander lucioperca]|uniref:uncharacterized protein LOC116063516 isoform X2 n=1 Tax=Sander lucioperca TaxID=283035 RepID=UPI00125CE15B|nr:uncharacterized protein LOC116063516 isoform X2 [Sander lucioperca]